MSGSTELGGRRLRTADLVTGVVIALVGAGMLILSLRMPTFAERSNVLTAPGIFPGLVGATLVALGLRLFFRARASNPPPDTDRPLALAPMLKGLALMLVAIVLVGRIDFRLLAGGFCLAFAAVFVDWGVPGPLVLRRAVATLVTVVFAAILVPLAFQHVFLVRMP